MLNLTSHKPMPVTRLRTTTFKQSENALRPSSRAEAWRKREGQEAKSRQCRQGKERKEKCAGPGQEQTEKARNVREIKGPEGQLDHYP